MPMLRALLVHIHTRETLPSLDTPPAKSTPPCDLTLAFPKNDRKFKVMLIKSSITIPKELLGTICQILAVVCARKTLAAIAQCSRDSWDLAMPLLYNRINMIEAGPSRAFVALGDPCSAGSKQIEYTRNVLGLVYQIDLRACFMSLPNYLDIVDKHDRALSQATERMPFFPNALTVRLTPGAFETIWGLIHHSRGTRWHHKPHDLIMRLFNPRHLIIDGSAGRADEFLVTALSKWTRLRKVTHRHHCPLSKRCLEVLITAGVTYVKTDPKPLADLEIAVWTDMCAFATLLALLRSKTEKDAM